MNDTKNQRVYKALQEARNIISNTKIEKKGVNKYAGFRYFTPEQVHELVSNACNETGLIYTFSLERDEHAKYIGILNLVHIDSGESLTFKMATEMPEIKGTNNAQQAGGMMTYTERYLKMSVFGIVENAFDFDANTGAEKEKEQKKIVIKQIEEEDDFIS